MSIYKFRLVAFDETNYWRDLPRGCTKVFGTYLFCEGERTHCCSLLPSSWCEHIENVFIGLDPEHPFVEEHAAFTGEDMYTFFIRPEQLQRFVSQPVEFEVGEDDVEAEAFDVETNTGRCSTLDDAMREVAWEQAREYFHGNCASIPVVDQAYSEIA